MSGAAFALVVNISLALLVAVAFLGLARSAEAPGVRWFGASYAIGAGTPLSELLVRLTPAPQIFAFTSSATFSLAFHVMAAGLARYYRVALPRWLLPTSFVASLLGRLIFWDAPRDVLWSGLLYQLPFSIALLICSAILTIGAPSRVLDRLLTAAFALAALHFLVKPFIAVAVGSGETARDYVDSRYALISQSMTAIVLIAVALSLILVVVTDMMDVSRRQADRDELSGLPNRRAFDRDGALLLAKYGKPNRTCRVLAFDLDLFKAINDTHGHDVGDQVIRAFAAALSESAPPESVKGRIGGEEFALLFPDAGPEATAAIIEGVRRRFGGIVFASREGTFRATFSCGVARSFPGESLQDVMVRCDRALYRAKAEGRDRVAEAAG